MHGLTMFVCVCTRACILQHAFMCVQEHVIVTSTANLKPRVETRGPLKEGQVGEDKRVIRMLAFYGVFGNDGKLVSEELSNQDSPLQITVKRARLTRVEVVVLVLYTGPMFVLYNGILRGFGNCGEVEEGIEFGSDAFWARIESVTVATRVAKSKNKFASTIHVLASAIKKLQGISDDEQGTILYRGLGGLDVHDFVKSRGFTEKAFMSTTKSLKVAMDYSGVKQGALSLFTTVCRKQ